MDRTQNVRIYYCLRARANLVMMYIYFGNSCVRNCRSAFADGETELYIIIYITVAVAIAAWCAAQYRCYRAVNSWWYARGPRRPGPDIAMTAIATTVQGELLARIKTSAVSTRKRFSGIPYGAGARHRPRPQTLPTGRWFHSICRTCPQNTCTYSTPRNSGGSVLSAVIYSYTLVVVVTSRPSYVDANYNIRPLVVPIACRLWQSSAKEHPQEYSVYVFIYT